MAGVNPVNQIPGDTCDNCKWAANPNASNTQIICMRYPPQGNDQFPKRNKSDWCGEHK